MMKFLSKAIPFAAILFAVSSAPAASRNLPNICSEILNANAYSYNQTRLRETVARRFHSEMCRVAWESTSSAIQKAASFGLSISDAQNALGFKSGDNLNSAQLSAKYDKLCNKSDRQLAQEYEYFNEVTDNYSVVEAWRSCVAEHHARERSGTFAAFFPGDDLIGGLLYIRTFPTGTLQPFVAQSVETTGPNVLCTYNKIDITQYETSASEQVSLVSVFDANGVIYARDEVAALLDPGVESAASLKRSISLKDRVEVALTCEKTGPKKRQRTEFTLNTSWATFHPPFVIEGLDPTLGTLAVRDEQIASFPNDPEVCKTSTEAVALFDPGNNVYDQSVMCGSGYYAAGIRLKLHMNNAATHWRNINYHVECCRLPVLEPLPGAD